jgi:hypothetical protein
LKEANIIVTKYIDYFRDGTGEHFFPGDRPLTRISLKKMRLYRRTKA